MSARGHVGSIMSRIPQVRRDVGCTVGGLRKGRETCRRRRAGRDLDRLHGPYPLALM